VETAHDLYQFTQLINDHFQYAEKEDLIFSMWQVAYADGHIEAIEDHIIRRVAGLVHLDHADFIRLKLKARDTLGGT
ncbi:MAG: TerB family tellurite resistance protein, partial [Gammaproteobacteria bacterium]